LTSTHIGAVLLRELAPHANHLLPGDAFILQGLRNLPQISRFTNAPNRRIFNNLNTL
jgi:hypothetical protein